MATTAEIESLAQPVAVSCPVSEDIFDTWIAYKKDPNNQELRNRLMERYFPLVKYNFSA